MTYEQITNLLDRGFTPDQITSLTISPDPTTGDAAAGGAGSGLSNHPQNAPADPPPTAANDTDAATPEAPAPDPTPAPADASADVLAAIADLKKTVQAQNIKTMTVDGLNSDAELESALAEIIRPKFERGA